MDELEDICRFCLLNASIGMRDFVKESELLSKITTCLPIQITICEYLPRHICLDCTDKIDDMYIFHKKVLSSQELLNDQLCKGTEALKNFYISLKEIKSEESIQNNPEIFIVTPAIDNPFKSEDIRRDPAIDGINIKEEIDIATEVVEQTDHNVDAEKTSNSDNETLASVKKSKDKNSDKDYQECTLNKYEDNSIEDDFDNFEFTVDDEPKIFPNTNNPDDKYKCLTCFKYYNTQRELQRHYEDDHRHKKINRENLNKHFKSIKSDDGIVTYKCVTCDKMYKSKRDINRHLIFTHTEERPFVCKICGRAYKTSYELILHDRAHSQPKYVCRYNCGYKTSYPGPLNEHEQRHRKEFKYKCECGKGFNIKTWYEQHKNVHLGLKPFICTICGASFHMEKYLTNHRIYRHPQSQADKKYECIHCSLPFDTKRALTEHMKVHRPEPLNPLCDLCGKVLKSMEALNLHVRSHFGDNPYKCSRCPKSFIKKCSLDRHEESHDQIKLHGCNDCDKRFMQRSTLLRHMRSKHGYPTFMQASKDNTKMPSVKKKKSNREFL